MGGIFFFFAAPYRLHRWVRDTHLFPDYEGIAKNLTALDSREPFFEWDLPLCRPELAKLSKAPC